jgi:type II secretory pathway component PulJ
MEKHTRFSRPLHGFSLRTLLIATTLVALVLGLIVWLNHH